MIESSAFLTARTVDVPGIRSSGWISGPNGKRALIAQNDREAGEPSPFPIEPSIEPAWQILEEALPFVQHLVVCLPHETSEAERILVQVAIFLRGEQVTIVTCECGATQERKRFANTIGLRRASWYFAECGGELTMRQLLEGFLGLEGDDRRES